MKNSLLLLSLFFIIFSYSHAQNDTTRKKKNFLQRMDSIQAWKLQHGRSTLTPYLAPSYTPEMQLMISIGGLYTFSLQKDNPSLSRSSIPFSFAYSTNNSIQASARPTIYGKNDKWRLAAEYWHKKMPDNYWGVGYEKGRYTPKSDSTTGYQRNWVQLKFKFNYRIWRDLFLGINYDYNQTRATDVNDFMASDPNYVESGSEIFNSGFGGLLRWDSRDFPENAYEGFLLELSGTGYGKFTTGNMVFQVIEFDYRQYQTLVREGSTLAWQVKTRYAGGDVPWTDLSMVGTPFDLRGYTWGQYRDHTMVFALAEYRHMFKRGKPNFRGEYYGPFGVVAWLGTGSIAHDYGTLNEWLPNGGVGFRFEIQERMNLRIDYGRGLETSAFYISFNEAF